MGGWFNDTDQQHGELHWAPIYDRTTPTIRRRGRGLSRSPVPLVGELIAPDPGVIPADVIDLVPPMTGYDDDSVHGWCEGTSYRRKPNGTKDVTVWVWVVVYVPIFGTPTDVGAGPPIVGYTPIGFWQRAGVINMTIYCLFSYDWRAELRGKLWYYSESAEVLIYCDEPPDDIYGKADYYPGPPPIIPSVDLRLSEPKTGSDFHELDRALDAGEELRKRILIMLFESGLNSLANNSAVNPPGTGSQDVGVTPPAGGVRNTGLVEFTMPRIGGTHSIYDSVFNEVNQKGYYDMPVSQFYAMLDELMLAGYISAQQWSQASLGISTTTAFVRVYQQGSFTY